VTSYEKVQVRLSKVQEREFVVVSLWNANTKCWDGVLAEFNHWLCDRRHYHSTTWCL